jgi:MtN3 and saliva related transmembrane protein
MFLFLLHQVGTEEILVSLIGVAAAVLTTSSFVPQIIKAYRTKTMDDVSHYLMSLFGTGTLLWMVYGFYKSDWVIVVANATATAFNVILLYLKFSYGKKSARST